MNKSLKMARHHRTRKEKTGGQPVDRYRKALVAAGIFSILVGLLIALDIYSGRAPTTTSSLLGFNQTVIGLAFVLIAVSGEKDGRKTKK